MGQPITVVRKRSHNPEIVRFEINRTLTGMGHECYTAPPDPLAKRPVDELARRIFHHGGVHTVHVHSDIVTVDLAKGSTGDGLEEVIRTLFLFYPESASADAAVETDKPVADATVAEQAEAVAGAGTSDHDVAEEAGDAAVPVAAAEERELREATPGTSSAVADSPDEVGELADIEVPTVDPVDPVDPADPAE
jgi:hypothetical protein